MRHKEVAGKILNEGGGDAKFMIDIGHYEKIMMEKF